MTQTIAPTVFGDPVDERALAQLENCLRDERAVAGALMADHHLGYSMPIGGVVAYDGAISPTGVGFDIACGNKAVLTNLRLQDLVDYETVEGPSDRWTYDAVKPLMREIQKRVAFGMGRNNADPVDHDLFDDDAWEWLEGWAPGLKAKAAAQLGTVGSGNHYVDLLADDDGRIWVANHFGSRGLGHTIASGFMAAHAGLDFTARVPETEDPIVLPLDEDLGQYYFEAMRLAGRYAYAGRDYVAATVLAILGATEVESVHNHHNYAWEEGGLWVVRKGATPLTREPAFIGGSMGAGAVIVRGLELTDVDSGGNPVTGLEDIGALGSAPHGAGRLMSRTAAAGKLRKVWACSTRDCDFQAPAKGGLPAPEHEHKMRKVRMRDKSTAAIDWQEVRADLTGRGIVVLGAGADEAPAAYKNLEEVLALHRNIEVVHRLTPLGVVMAGPDTYDPYKD